MSFITATKHQVQSTMQNNFGTFAVSFSDAEAQVIKYKAAKAGISVSEYLRNAALGFPMG